MIPAIMGRRIRDYNWEAMSYSEKAVLCFVLQGQRVLLMRKKRGLGRGKINGPGGRLEPGETYHDAAVRETQEELGITPRRLRDAAHLTFVFTDGYSLDARVFTACGYDGEVVETDEGDPMWFHLSEIPYTEMWADDPLWLPHVLAGRYVRGRFVFEGDTMLDDAVEVGAPHAPTTGAEESRSRRR